MLALMVLVLGAFDLLPLAPGVSVQRDQRPPGQHSRPAPWWTRVTDEERDTVIEQALLQPEEPPRQIAFMVTDHCGFSVSESTVYRVLKAKGLIW